MSLRSRAARVGPIKYGRGAGGMIFFLKYREFDFCSVKKHPLKEFGTVLASAPCVDQSVSAFSVVNKHSGRKEKCAGCQKVRKEELFHHKSYSLKFSLGS